MANPPRRIPANIVEALEAEMQDHESYLHQTLARKLREAGVDLSQGGQKA